MSRPPPRGDMRKNKRANRDGVGNLVVYKAKEEARRPRWPPGMVLVPFFRWAPCRRLPLFFLALFHRPQGPSKERTLRAKASGALVCLPSSRRFCEGPKIGPLIVRGLRAQKSQNTDNLQNPRIGASFANGILSCCPWCRRHPKCAHDKPGTVMGAIRPRMAKASTKERCRKHNPHKEEEEASGFFLLVGRGAKCREERKTE